MLQAILKRPARKNGLVTRDFLTRKWYLIPTQELPKYQALDELIVINTGSRSGAIAVLAYMTFTVCLTPLHYHAFMLLFTL